jgi:hypothetical protein
MPFGIKEIKSLPPGKRWVVYRKDTGKIKSHHASAAKAGASKGYAERGSRNIPKVGSIRRKRK